MRTVMVCCVVMAVCAGVASAAIDAPWLGDDYTAGAGWDTFNGGFNFGNQAISADFFDVIPSDAALAYADDPDLMVGQGAYYMSSYNGRYDVIEVGQDDDLDFWMPSFVGVDDYTEIWVQVTYEPFEDIAPSFNLETNNTFDNPTVDLIHGAYFEGQELHADGWVTDAYSFVVEPAAECIWLTVNFDSPTWDPYPMYVDSVVIDMVNVPEPVSVALLGLGLVFIRRRK